MLSSAGQAVLGIRGPGHSCEPRIPSLPQRSPSEHGCAQLPSQLVMVTSVPGVNRSRCVSCRRSSRSGVHGQGVSEGARPPAGALGKHQALAGAAAADAEAGGTGLEGSQ